MVALLAAAQELTAGNTVILLDYEDRLDTAVRRLVNLGCQPDHIRTGLRYITPTIALKGGGLPTNVIDAAGTATRVIDDHIGLLLPEPVDPNSPDETDLGGTFIGTTAESLDPSYAIEGDEAGIVAGVYRSEDPIAIWTKAAAIALPVLATPDLAMACTVATDI